MSAGRSLLVAVALAVFTQPAWAQKVHTDFDPNADFSAIHTYTWKADYEPTDNDLMNDRIMAAVDHWLTMKGWEKADEGEEADVTVAAHVTEQQGQSLQTFYDDWGPGWGWEGWGPGLATTTVQTYTKGTMVVDIFNNDTMRLIWRGTATETMSDPPDPQKVAEKIQKATEKMFKNDFPPEPKDDD